MDTSEDHKSLKKKGSDHCLVGLDDPTPNVKVPRIAQGLRSPFSMQWLGDLQVYRSSLQRTHMRCFLSVRRVLILKYNIEGSFLHIVPISEQKSSFFLGDFLTFLQIADCLIVVLQLQVTLAQEEVGFNRLTIQLQCMLTICQSLVILLQLHVAEGPVGVSIYAQTVYFTIARGSILVLAAEEKPVPLLLELLRGGTLLRAAASQPSSSVYLSRPNGCPTHQLAQLPVTLATRPGSCPAPLAQLKSCPFLVTSFLNACVVVFLFGITLHY
uniref:Uncharacterized protein n=1 Tax=Oryzias latipes TaxID=8090 RepID=A0A3P9M639_ORYLA